MEGELQCGQHVAEGRNSIVAVLWDMDEEALVVYGRSNKQNKEGNSSNVKTVASWRIAVHGGVCPECCAYCAANTKKQ